MKKIKILTKEDLKTTDKILFFDKIDNFIQLISLIKVRKKYDYFVTSNIESKFYLHKFIFNTVKINNLKLFDFSIFNFSNRTDPYRKAYESVEHVYEYLKESNKIPTNIVNKLYKSSTTDLAFKKEIIKQLYYYFNTNKIIALLNESENSLHFIPSYNWRDVNRILYNYNNFIKTHHIPFVVATSDPLGKKLNWLISLINKIKLSITLFVIPFWLVTKVHPILRSKKAKVFDLAIRVYNNGFRLEKNEIKVDWPIDNINFNNKNTIFVAEDKLDKFFKKSFNHYGYTLIDLSYHGFVMKNSIGVILNELRRLFSFMFKVFFYCHKTNYCLKNVIILPVLNYFRWKTFVHNWQPKSYLCYHNYHTEHIFRNIILESVGCKTIMYKHTTNDEYLYDENNYGKAILAFMKYNKEFHWGIGSVKMAKRNKGQSDNYITVGPIWNSLIPNVQQSCHISLIDNDCTNNSVIIGAFPTSFINGITGMVNGSYAHYHFLKYLYELLKNEKYDFIVYFKGKYPFYEYISSGQSELVNVCHKLKNSGKFSIIDHQIPAGNVIVKADICISMPFSTPGIEALLFGKRSLYYDVNNSFPNAYYKKFPYFVIQSKKNAYEYLDYWMNLNQNDIADYYNKYVAFEYPNYNITDSPFEKIIGMISSKSKQIRN